MSQSSTDSDTSEYEPRWKSVGLRRFPVVSSFILLMESKTIPEIKQVRTDSTEEIRYPERVYISRILNNLKIMKISLIKMH